MPVSYTSSNARSAEIPNDCRHSHRHAASVVDRPTAEFGWSDTNREDDRGAVERRLARDPEALLLAVADSEIVGSMIAGSNGWRTHLCRVAAREDWRRCGVSRALVARAEPRFETVGSRRADAMVLEDNEQGQAAWRAFGYSPQQEWRRWVKRLAGQGS